MPPTTGRPGDAQPSEISGIRNGVDVVRPSDIPQLVEVWEASVRASHDFLSNDDITGYRPIVRDRLYDAMELYAVRDEAGDMVAFSGVAEGQVCDARGTSGQPARTFAGTCSSSQA